MTLSIAFLLAVLVAAVILFAIDKIPPDAVALGVLVVLMLSGILEPGEAFSGFGSDTVMLMLGLLIMAAALSRTGVIDLLGRAILRRTGSRPFVVMLAATGGVSLLSAFMSNTASAAVFVPLVMGLAGRLRISPSRLLMPVAFGSILASSVTLISTSTNIVVSGLMTQHGLAPIRMFELTPVGIPIALLGLAYLLTIGVRLIPERAPPDEGGLIRLPFLTEVVVLPGSRLAGRTLAESGLGRDLDLTVLDVIRDKDRHLTARADTRLLEGDLLLVEGERDDILRVKETAGIDIKADVKHAHAGVGPEELRLVEAILLPRSPLTGRTLKEVRFRERYELQVLAINRQGEILRGKISQIPLRLGDTLLLQGRPAEIAALADSGLFRIISAVGGEGQNRRRAPLALAIFAGAIVLAALNLVPLPVAVLLGALLVFATGCVTPEEAYREVDWRVIVLIGSMLALGVAMQSTGAARYLAGQIVSVAAEAGPVALLAGFFLLTVLLTQPMSNQAAAAVVVPIAIETAGQLQLNPRSFVMMIAIAASCSYLTPLEPACLMVYGPGRYRFKDFLRVGGLLTVLIFVAALVLVPRVWPLGAR